MVNVRIPYLHYFQDFEIMQKAYPTTESFALGFEYIAEPSKKLLYLEYMAIM